MTRPIELTKETTTPAAGLTGSATAVRWTARVDGLVIASGPSKRTVLALARHYVETPPAVCAHNFDCPHYS